MAKMYEKADNIKEYLRFTGNYVKSNELEIEFNLTGSEVRKCINFLRSEYEPIISGVDGYKYTRNPEEIEESIKRITHHADEMMKTVIRLKVIQSQLNSKGRSS